MAPELNALGWPKEAPASDDPFEGSPEIRDPGAQPPDEQVSPPTTEPVTEPVATEPDPNAEPVATEPATEPDPNAPAEPTRLAGRFEKPEDLERAYLELEQYKGRAGYELAQERQRTQQLEGLLTQAAAALQQPTQPQPSQPAAPAQLDPRVAQYAEQIGLPSEALPLIQQLAAAEAERQVAARSQEFQQQLTAQQAQMLAAGQQQYQQQTAQQAQLEASMAVDQFKRTHSDITPDQEHQIASVVTEFDLFPDLSNLEFAREVAADQDLHRVIQAQPQLMDTDAGVEYARLQASIARAMRTGQAPAAGPDNEAARQAAIAGATVTRGGSGAPADPAGQAPKTSYDAALDLAKAQRGNRLGI